MKRIVFIDHADRRMKRRRLVDPEAEAMRTTCDSDVDALYLGFSEDAIVESEEVRPGVIFDLDGEGRVVGIEILDASLRMARGTDLKAFAAP